MNGRKFILVGKEEIDFKQSYICSGSVVLGYKARGDMLAKSGVEGAAAGAGAQETSFSPRIPDKVCSSVKVTSPDVVAGDYRRRHRSLNRTLH